MSTQTPRGTGWAALPLALVVAAPLAAIAGRPFLGTLAGLGALVSAILIVLATRPETRRFAPVVAPTLVAVAFGLYGLTDRGAIETASRGDPGFLHRSAVLTAIGLAALILILVGVDVARWMGRAVAVAIRAISAAAGAVVFVLVVLPGWVVHRLRPRRRLGGGGPTPAWVAIDARDLDARSAGSTAPSAGGRTLTGRVTWAVGCVVLILAVNYGLGWAWDSVVASPSDEAGDDGTPQPSETAAQVVDRDPRVDSPALADAPWRERYFADLQRTPGTYWPFTEYRPLPFASPYINVEGWSRRTYEPTTVDGSAPVIWMFGGSTTFGEGQRDDYTIASWIARLAEEAGTPVRVENFGQRGWTHFQEAVLFEQLLADADEPPDFALFYDGANEITTQSLLEEAVPSHTLASSYAERLTGGVATELVQEPPPEDVAGEIWNAYSQHSLAHKVVRQLQSQPAGAGTPPTDPDDPLFTPDQDTDEDGSVSNYQLTDQDGTDAGKVYERGKAITQGLAERYDVTPLFFWQPVAYKGGPVEAALAELSDSTVDISGLLLDHQEVFIDGGHTNEEGARLVAAEIWSTIAPMIDDWYGSR